MQDLVFKYISDNYSVIDNGLYDNDSGYLILPSKLENRINLMFGFDKDLSGILTYNWLYLNGMREIKKYWDIYNEDSLNTLIKKHLVNDIRNDG